MDATKSNIAIYPPGPAGKAEEAKVSDEAKPSDMEQTKASDSKPAGAPASAAAHLIPKPVEVQSVPETPVNATTPANGTPRPELEISSENEQPEKPRQGDETAAGVVEPLPTPADSEGQNADEPIVDKAVAPNGAGAHPPVEMTGALPTVPSQKGSEPTETGAGEKHKLDDDPDDEEQSDEQVKEKQGSEDAERADKKAKVDAVEGKTNGGPQAKGKPGRPRKDKGAPSVVGKTARKTRSQGPAEA